MSTTDGSEQTLRIQEWLGADLEDHVITTAARDLYTLWRKKKSQTQFVSRRDMDIVELSPWIGRLAIHDYLPDLDDYICRVFGETVRRRIGIDLTRRRLSELPPEISKRMRARYDRVRGSGEPLLCHIMSFAMQLGVAEFERFPTELLILPLSRSGCDYDCTLVLSQALD